MTAKKTAKTAKAKEGALSALLIQSLSYLDIVEGNNRFCVKSIPWHEVKKRGLIQLSPLAGCTLAEGFKADMTIASVPPKALEGYKSGSVSKIFAKEDISHELCALFFVQKNMIKEALECLGQTAKKLPKFPKLFAYEKSPDKYKATLEEIAKLLKESGL